jgi:hypothetical protein
MRQILKAEYDDATNTLRLLEPVEGIAAHEEVLVTIDQTAPKKASSHLKNGLKGETAEGVGEAHPIKKAPPWSDLRGLLSGEEGEKFARDIEEAFPTEPVRK